MSVRARFLTVAAVVLALVFLLIVVVPALQHGGLGELIFIFAAFGAVLLFERFLRAR